jgi:hypothetical protein
MRRLPGTDTWRAVLAIVFLVLALVVTGYFDRQAMLKEQAQYCDMVSRGLWPDFHNSYEADCDAPAK